MNSKQQKNLLDSFVEVVRRTSCELPKDVKEAIKAGREAEVEGSQARYAMDIIWDNIRLAKEKSQPICQDTGSILFFLHYPQKLDGEDLSKLLSKAVIKATSNGYLRQNSVDSLSGKNSGNNVGPGSPTVHALPWKKNYIDLRIILKGGGSENMGTQYSLPDSILGAGRDLNGVKKCILDAVNRAQGKGCGPGVLAVGVGGDRSSGFLLSKEQLLRKLSDKNKNELLRDLEDECLQFSNQLGIGPMGFGGKTTLLGVKVGVLNRLPASFFVSGSYMCWACRRQGAKISPVGKIQSWFY